MQQTEFPFILPQGYLDLEGNTHKEGIMRLSTAYDEIAPMRDPRVQKNPGYLVIILLARTVVRLGTLEQINTKVIEGLFSGDFVYLQDFYQRINQNGHSRLRVACPHCGGEFEVETTPLGGVVSYPLERLMEEVAYLAYHFHWSYEQIMRMEHRERQQWVGQVAQINQRLNDNNG